MKKKFMFSTAPEGEGRYFSQLGSVRNCIGAEAVKRDIMHFIHLHFNSETVSIFLRRRAVFCLIDSSSSKS